MFRLFAVASIIVTLGATSAHAHLSSESVTPNVRDTDCPVTPYAVEGLADSLTTTWYGEDELWAGLARGDKGMWFADPMWMKVQWRRPTGESLEVEGRRLDAPAPPLQVKVTPGYDIFPYQVTAMTFPTEGCWEVTGRVSRQELRFVVFVHPGSQDARVKPLPTPEPSVWDTLQRPLRLPPLDASGACPRTAGRQIPRLEGTVLGDGPVYIQGLGGDDVLYAYDRWTTDGSSTVPLRWIVSPDYVGHLLIRGQALATGEELHFGVEDPQVMVQRRQSINVEARDWLIWDAPELNVREGGPGCYAVQIDGRDFTEVIVVEVSQGTPPGVEAPQP